VACHDVTFADANPVHATLKSLIHEYDQETRNMMWLIGYDDNWRNHLNEVSENFAGLTVQGQEFIFP